MAGPIGVAAKLLAKKVAKRAAKRKAAKELAHTGSKASRKNIEARIRQMDYDRRLSGRAASERTQAEKNELARLRNKLKNLDK